jgi:hypothetical protein
MSETHDFSLVIIATVTVNLAFKNTETLIIAFTMTRKIYLAKKN